MRRAAVPVLLLTFLGLAACVGKALRPEPRSIIGEWVPDTSNRAVDEHVESISKVTGLAETDVENRESRHQSEAIAATWREMVAANLRASRTVMRFERGGRLLYWDTTKDPDPQVWRWRQAGGELEITPPGWGGVARLACMNPGGSANAPVFMTGRLSNGRLYLRVMNFVEMAWVRR